MNRPREAAPLPALESKNFKDHDVTLILDYVIRLVEYIHDHAHPKDLPISQQYPNKEHFKGKILSDICNFITREIGGADVENSPIRIEAILGTRTGRDIFTLLETYSAEHPLIQPSVHQHFLDLILRINDEAGAVASHVNTSGKIEKLNNEFTLQLWYTDNDLVGKGIENMLITTGDINTITEAFFQLAHWKNYTGEHTFLRKDGTTFWGKIWLVNIDPQDSEKWAICAIKNVTRRRNLELKLEEQRVALKTEEFTDERTGLFNAEFLKQYVPNALLDAEKNNSKLVLISVDIIDFHNVNHLYGHEIGDRILQLIGQRLQETLRASDIVSFPDQKLIRANGNQFLVVSSVESSEDVDILAEKILNSFSNSFVLTDINQPVHLTPSIGVSVYPEDGEDYSSLVRNAEMAMYASKKAGGGTFQLYKQQMSDKLLEDIQLEADILHAFENNEFVLYYQPQIDIVEDKLAWVEALIRWNHPEKWLLAPGAFIPFIEGKELLANRLWRWVFKAACEQAAVWKTQGRKVKIGVNFSVLQFSNKQLIQEIETTLNETGADPKYIEVEVVEGALKDIDTTAKILKQLKKLGFHISIDDFGSGYSSFAHITRFPSDTLKIDKSFVDNIKTDQGLKLIQGMIALANILGKQVLVEGVETELQYAMLRGAWCRYIQGYYFSKPLPTAGLETKYFQENTDEDA